MTQAWCECQSDPSEQSALARQPFVSQLGHYTPELFLTFLLILKIRWNGSSKGYSEQGGASPENSLPLAWMIPCVFPVSALKHIFLTCEDPIKKKKSSRKEDCTSLLSWLLLSVFSRPRSNWNPSWYNPNTFSLVLSSGKVRRLSGQCLLRIFFERFIISNSGCCLQILREAWFTLPMTWSSLILWWGLWNPAGAVGDWWPHVLKDRASIRWNKAGSGPPIQKVLRNTGQSSEVPTPCLDCFPRCLCLLTPESSGVQAEKVDNSGEVILKFNKHFWTRAENQLPSCMLGAQRWRHVALPWGVRSLWGRPVYKKQFQ